MNIPTVFASGDLVTFDGFAHAVPMTKRTFERLSASGAAPAGTRFSPKGPVFYSTTAVRDWIADRLAPVGACPATEPEVARPRVRRWQAEVRT